MTTDDRSALENSMNQFNVLRRTRGTAMASALLAILLPATAWSGTDLTKLPTAAEWQGKYPFERKPGFYGNAALRDAATALLGAKRHQEMLLGWTVAAPIVADGEALLSWTCKPHDCGGNNQATLIDQDRVLICVHERGRTTWYLPDRKQPISQPGPADTGPAGAGQAGQGCNFETVQQARQALAAFR
jgi:hypothetical protein